MDPTEGENNKKSLVIFLKKILKKDQFADLGFNKLNILESKVGNNYLDQLAKLIKITVLIILLLSILGVVCFFVIFTFYGLDILRLSDIAFYLLGIITLNFIYLLRFVLRILFRVPE